MRTGQDNDDSSKSDLPSTGSELASAVASAESELISLAPHFVTEHHQSYLDRLEKALQNAKNRNIAITGRYGAGKSSVLNEFEQGGNSKALRLAISTLSPTDHGESLTNRIQKELVKQLVYSASPRTLRHSRFRRSLALPWWKSILEASAAVVLLGAFLALLGWLPPVVGTSPGHDWRVQTASWVSFVVILVAALSVLRRLTHDRFVVSDVSAGGATIKLSERTPTYFDEYFDDIVNYFDSETVDIVIFEDLDRFDDPHIFEALRELNTLLNNTHKRKQDNQPLRFVYAVRDSLFEKLGTDKEYAYDDAAAAETIRANRTKFFDIVIPMVPFISHRNARDLLTDLLKGAGIVGIERRLINLVAQHSTDMRLLRNMCNEYLVFSERLLKSHNSAPGLTPSNLFALVAYKNFHLKDFENIARRTSALDRLNDLRRAFVRKAITDQEQLKRDLASKTELTRTRDPLARKLAIRLNTLAEVYRMSSGQGAYRNIVYRIGDRDFLAEQVSSYEFWQAAQHSATITIMASHGPGISPTAKLAPLSQSDLAALFPEAMDSHRWDELDAEATRAQVAEIERSIVFLRSAEFADLADNPNYTLSVSFPVPAKSRAVDGALTPKEPEREYSFGELVDTVLESDLARTLVQHRYIDRNFALYAAQFYGHFTGIDVANFIVQNVQTNTMEPDYQFASPEAVRNLLDEADEDFTETVAALNTDILNYLLATKDTRASNIVDYLISDFDDNGREFLASYLTSGAHRGELAAHLAGRPWRRVFIHLVIAKDVPDDARPALVDSALRAMDQHQSYELPAQVGEFLVEHYRDMAAFTKTQGRAVNRKLLAVLSHMDIYIPDISVLDAKLRALVAAGSRYQLSAGNIRAAIEDAVTTSPSDAPDCIALDRVRVKPAVYVYCLRSSREYLAAIDQDKATTYSVLSAQTLVAVLIDVADQWEIEEVAGLIDRASPESRLASLTGVPVSTWPVLAAAVHFRPSLSNVESYRHEMGAIDNHLAEMLCDAGTIHTDGPGDIKDESGNEFDRAEAAIALLNASAIPDPAVGVRLVCSLDPEFELPVGEITPQGGELFSLLLEHKLIADDVDSFKHFRDSGWSALGPAIAVSDGVTSFLTADLVHGMVADVLNDPKTRDKLGPQITENADEFVADDDCAGLEAIARYADREKIRLTPETVVRIAQTQMSSTRIVLRLLHYSSPQASAQHIVDVFAEIGKPYSDIEVRGAVFHVGYDELHETLLTVLSEGGVCLFKKRRGKNQYTVTVA